MSFNRFDNLSVNAQNAVEIPLNGEASKVYATSWSTGQPIDWIWYSDSNQALYVYNQTVWGFTFGKQLLLILIDEWDNSSKYGTYWVKVASIDSWNNRIESNEFNVTINPSLPSSQTNRIDSIDIYENHYA